MKHSYEIFSENSNKILHIIEFLLSSFFLVPLAHAYSNNGYQIKDLVLTDQNFIIEAASWIIPPSSISSFQRYSICDGDVYVVGGYGVTKAGAVFTRTYKNLEEHSMIFFSIHFWLIDSWDSGDTFYVKFDNVLLNFWNTFDFSSFTSDVCGMDLYKDVPNLQITGKVPHTGSTLTFQVISALDQDSSDESIGFRDMTFLLYNSPALISPLEYCGDWFDPSSLTCSCGLSEYSAGSSGCLPCSTECASCFGPSAGECYACNDGYWFDGSQCQPCDSACKTCYGGENGQCNTCKSGYSLYLNATCVNTCSLGLSFDSNQIYCDAICPNSNEYVYPDRTCKVGCEAPYKVSRAGSYPLCILRCPVSEYYLKSSSECLSTCPSGTFEYDVRMSCEACPDDQCAKCSGTAGSACTKCKDGAILDNDGVCKVCEEMEFEYIKSTNTGPQYQMVLSPDSCDLTLSYVKANLIGKGSSLPSFTLKASSKMGSGVYIVDITLKDTVLDATNMDLTLGFLSTNVIVPKQFIPSDTLLALSKATSTAAAATSAAFGASFVGVMSIGASAALWSMINSQQFVGYLIFINIDYPFQLELFFDLLQSSGLSFLPNPLSGVSDMIDERFPSFKGDLSAEKYLPPAKFVKQELTSFFIETGGAEFMMNLVFFVALLIIPMILRFRQLPFRNTLRKFHFGLKWNITARSFLESGIPISLAIFLQLRKVTFDTFYNTASMILAIAALLYFMIMINFLLEVLYLEDKKGLEEKKFKLKYGTLCEGLRIKHFVAKYYNIMILFRGVLLAFLVVFFEDWPLLQTIPLVIYNIGLIYCLFQRVEFENKILTKINQIKEIMILLGILLIICLNVKNKSLKYYDHLGWIALGLFLGAFLTELLYTFGIQIFALKQGIVKLKAYFSNVKKVFDSGKEKEKQKIKEKPMPQIQMRPRIMVRQADGTLSPRKSHRQQSP